jgi:hypothetical protein
MKKLLILLLINTAHSYEYKLDSLHKTKKPFEREDKIISRKESKELEELTKTLYQLPLKYYDFQNLKVNFQVKKNKDPKRNKIHQDRLRYLFSPNFYDNIMYVTKLEECNNILIENKVQNDMPYSPFKKTLVNDEYLILSKAFGKISLVEELQFQELNTPFSPITRVRSFEHFDHQSYLETTENIPKEYSKCYTKIKRTDKAALVTNFIKLPEIPLSLTVFHYHAYKDFNVSTNINDVKNEIIKYRAGELLYIYHTLADTFLKKTNKYAEYKEEFNKKYEEFLKHPYFKHYKVRKLKKDGFGLIDVRRSVFKKATLKNNTLNMKDTYRVPISRHNHQSVFINILKKRGQ